MEQPWGLSGPEFLNIYWIALGISVLFAIGVRIRMRASRVGAPAGSVDVDELAYLAGGPRRVVEASLARLIEAEALRSTRRGTVGLIGKPKATNAVDRAVLADAGRYSNRTLNLLMASVVQADAVKAVGTRLSGAGMLIEPSTAKRELRVGALPMVVLFAIGVVRWVNGIAIGAPVGWLTLQLILTAVLVVLLTRSGSIRRTAAGDRALEGARSGSRAAASAGGVAGLVALGGLSAHPDLALRTSLMYTAASTSSGGGYVSSGTGCSTGGSSCSSGGGSSCGGGGGCGGGGS
ncbi:TIGR04222 domain-containing membrane protein [Umezawaea endophytica]|uniref:TIGR04222 domain-containing membrane protein n=1 Tax=Umezawaea endophytica TaxID=1654476 RepID=A0A9X3AKE8_9PSEU|nr:TIGR04222 domain-containing membrane protein [Umezawaea endophytica]MCS7482760.1 TIGR04222 domain-containing membrane protein [Umezawaea endophytica]